MSQQFGVRFTQDTIPAWKSYYIDYHSLKELVHKIEKQNGNNAQQVPQLGDELVNVLAQGIASAEGNYRRVVDTLRHEVREIENFPHYKQRLEAFWSSYNAKNTEEFYAGTGSAHVEHKVFQQQNRYQRRGSTGAGAAAPGGETSPRQQQPQNATEEEMTSNVNFASDFNPQSPTTKGNSNTTTVNVTDQEQQQQELLPFNSLCAEVIGEEMRAALESNNTPADPDLQRLVQLYQVTVKLFRFLELNFLAAQRVLMKFEQHALNPSGNRATSDMLENILEKAHNTVQRSRFASGSNLLRSTEVLMRRIMDVSLALFGEADVQRYFSVTDAKAAEKKTGWTWSIKWKYVILSFLVLVVFLAVPIYSGNLSAHNCAAMILCVAVLWVTEAIPFFTTAMLIPLLAVPLQVLPGLDDGQTGKKLLAATFDHVQILVLGGLCMGKALGKHKIEHEIARICLKPLANRPRLFVLMLMVLSVIACAFLSNVAAPVLILKLVQPTLWKMSRAEGAPQAILLCLAWASNAGGMVSVIASPQNAVALKALGDQPIGFLPWMGAALPIVIVEVLLGWFITLQIWQPFSDPNYVVPVVTGDESENTEDADDFENDHTSSTKRMLSMSGSSSAHKQKILRAKMTEKWLVISTCLITVVLWCLPQTWTFGDAGVVALIPIVVFFGVGVLQKEDFNGLPWHLLFLLAGGNMLGICAKESGLLKATISSIQPFLEQNSEIAVVSVLILAIALITTFVSHTVSSLIILPVIVQIAHSNPQLPSAQALVFLSVIQVSGSQIFPITSFPNVNSLLAEDEHGESYLTPKHFLLPGGILSIASIAQLIAFGLPMTVQLFPKSAENAPTAVPGGGN